MDRLSLVAWLRRPETLSTALVGSLSLGLAPFLPEPHVLGTIRWVLGGGVGMQPIDYGDLVLHGAPWLLLAMVIVVRAVDRIAALVSHEQRS